MKFAEHQFQQQVEAIQNQLAAIKKRLDSLENARTSDQPLIIVTQSGSLLPWVNQPLSLSLFNGKLRVSLGDEWISGPLSLNEAKALIQACLAHRLEGGKTFDVEKYLHEKTN